MILCDRRIKALANAGMITPFIPELVSRVCGNNVISFGLSSYGYDIRLSAKEFKVFRHIPGEVVDAKAFNPAHLVDAPLHIDEWGDYFIIPGNSYGLGVAVERLAIPNHITVTCTGKSTYARVGLIANITPVEAGWEGHLTLEFSNCSPADCKIYANEGVVQLLFFEGEPCDVSYGDRKGKYQNQDERITPAAV